jgi:hypothetical protein
MPSVAKVIELPFKHGSLQWAERRALARQWRGKFDRAYVMPNSLKSALIPWLAGIPLRIGYHGESRYVLLNQRLPNPTPENHPSMVPFYYALSGQPLVNKHLIRPVLTYSYIPPELQKENRDHPFLKQIQYANDHKFSGYNFDDYDIVPTDNSPLTSTYFTPLGHSLNIGFTTQWIRRNGSVESTTPSYLKYIDLSAGEAINFRELEKACDQYVTNPDGSITCSQLHNSQPLSRFYSTLDLKLGKFTYSHLYYYYPYINGERHSLSSTLSYVWDRGIHQKLYSYDRSISVSYNWDQIGYTDPVGTHNVTFSGAYSVSDYLLPTAYLSYDFITHKFLNIGGQVQLQSPSRCWKFSLMLGYDTNAVKQGDSNPLNGFNFGTDLQLNISGTGFGGMGDLAAAASATR